MAAEIPFVKMEAAGNDYIYIDTAANSVPALTDHIPGLCDRSRGIGGDGVVLMGKNRSGDCTMTIYNSDGSEAEICGNALRCVGYYLYVSGYCPEPEFRVLTKAGSRTIHIEAKGPHIRGITTDMGIPSAAAPFPAELRIPGEETSIKVYNISMGNPHAVVFTDGTPKNHFETLAPLIGSHPLYPEKTNVEFVEVKSPDRLNVRVYERGSGETLACGTGACAAHYAAYRKGSAASKASIVMRGGILETEILPAEERIFLKGPCRTVFTGSFSI